MDTAAEVHRDRATARAFRSDPVSFIRRGGRLTERQQRAWNDLYVSHVVDVPRHGPSTSVDPEFRLDVEALFGRKAPLVVEIGSGRGEALVAAATEHPERDFLGLEVYVPGVAQTLVTMRHEGVTNVRLAVVNATEALATMLAPQSVRELWTWFPDPWHKKRHHKRRLVTVPFTQLVARVLEPGGTWRFATDWEDYAEVAEQVISASPHVDGGPVLRHEERALTRFERKGVDAGRTIHDLAATPTLTP
jgi:tRNA (guanine-N7-)-methyltransferase